MAEILPFRGILYNKKKVKNIENIVAPPYDVISPGMRDELYKAHSRNIVRIILGKELSKDSKEDNKYTKAADFLKKWLKDHTLSKDKKPSIYIYGQEYLHKGKLKTRIGFVSLMKIEDPSSSLVLPHEHTFFKPKEDRLNLIRKTKANTSPIFCIFQDNSNIVTNIIGEYAANKGPIIDIHFEGVGHKLWRMQDSTIIKKIKKELDKKQVFIADGHHRYEVALSFRDEMRRRLGGSRARKFDNVLVYFTNLTEENLTIFSTYRVIRNVGKGSWSHLKRRLAAYFNIEMIKDKNEMFEKLENNQTGHTFGVYFKNRQFYLLRLKGKSVLDEVIKVDKSREWKRLNVTVLHFLIFDHILHIERFSSNDENIVYTRDENYAIDLVDKGECDIAFFQLPTKVGQVQNIARGGDRMPHKSTYFYPKLLTGLVINKF
jgi:uncharacterized protein (DUF1015 family)